MYNMQTYYVFKEDDVSAQAILDGGYIGADALVPDQKIDQPTKVILPSVEPASKPILELVYTGPDISPQPIQDQPEVEIAA